MKIIVIVSILVLIAIPDYSVSGSTMTKASLKQKAFIIYSDMKILDDAWHRYSIKHNGDTPQPSRPAKTWSPT